MKGLVKILAPLVVAGTLFTAKPVSANDFFSNLSENPFLSIGVGTYNGIKQKQNTQNYEITPMIRGSVGSDGEIGNIRFEMNVSYTRKKEQPYEFDFGAAKVKGNSRINILEYGPLLKYVFRGDRINFYAGGGLVEVFIKEQLEEKIYFNDKVIEFKGNKFDFAFGIILSAGLEIPVSKEKKNNLIYMEASGRYAMITNKFSQRKNVCGLALDAGIRRFVRIK